MQIDPKMIPADAVLSARPHVCTLGCGPSVVCRSCENKARAAFVAMVEHWPDMAHRVMPYAAIILPLMENGNG